MTEVVTLPKPVKKSSRKRKTPAEVFDFESYHRRNVLGMIESSEILSQLQEMEEKGQVSAVVVAVVTSSGSVLTSWGGDTSPGTLARCALAVTKAVSEDV